MSDSRVASPAFLFCALMVLCLPWYTQPWGTYPLFGGPRTTSGADFLLSPVEWGPTSDYQMVRGRALILGYTMALLFGVVAGLAVPPSRRRAILIGGVTLLAIGLLSCLHWVIPPHGQHITAWFYCAYPMQVGCLILCGFEAAGLGCVSKPAPAPTRAQRVERAVLLGAVCAVLLFLHVLGMMLPSLSGRNWWEYLTSQHHLGGLNLYACGATAGLIAGITLTLYGCRRRALTGSAHLERLAHVAASMTGVLALGCGLLVNDWNSWRRVAGSDQFSLPFTIYLLSLVGFCVVAFWFLARSLAGPVYLSSLRKTKNEPPS